jgi:hypothetical protein
MREPSLKAKYLLLPKEPFSLDIPYTDRQRVVIVADEQAAAERVSRARVEVTRENANLPTASIRTLPNDDLSDPTISTTTRAALAAAAGRSVHSGVHAVQHVSANMARTVNERAASMALRRQLGALMIGQSDSEILHFDRGHPLKNVLYIGHPAKPDLYFPAAEFHRRVFEHKFIEAVTLLRSLGARRIVVQQQQGHTQGKERTGFIAGLGFTFTRGGRSQFDASFEAEFPGHGKPVIPDALYWYSDEPTWRMISDARIVGGAGKTSLAVTYMTDYGIDTRVVKAAGKCGVNIGGKFQEQQNTIWQLDAEFPALAT